MNSKTLNRILKSKRVSKYTLTDKQLYQVGRIADWYDLPDNKVYYNGMLEAIDTWLECGLDSSYIERYKRSKRLGSVSSSLIKWVYTYGKVVGLSKYKEYVEFQRVKNTFEYKNKHLGMSRDDFDLYNASRSSTIDNFIKRYGIVDGSAKWDEYVSRQSYAGVRVEYFIEMLGEVDGRLEWERVCRLKSHNIENIMMRDSCDASEALIRLIEIRDRACSGYSKVSQELFWAIYEQLDDKDKQTCYFPELNKEFGKWDYDSHSYKKWDFTLTDRKFIIEFNGDWYHANPKMYNPSDILTIHGTKTTAAELWAKDSSKNSIIESQGYTVITVWQSDFNNDKLGTINRCLNAIGSI